MATHLCALVRFGSLLLMATSTTIAEETFHRDTTGAKAVTSTPSRMNDATPANVLPPTQWRRVDAAVNRALSWLSNRQQPDGSFPTLDSGQPAVTSLCMMAFIAHG